MDQEGPEEPFEYHTFLHHSQTENREYTARVPFEYHTFLHHSQTQFRINANLPAFEYHTFLHHSQTESSAILNDISV